MEDPRGLDFYLRRMEELKIEPNFWVNRDYLQLCLVESHEADGWVWLEDDGVCLFPPLPCEPISFDKLINYPVDEVWSDFANRGHPSFGETEFLDWEYIFDPSDFLDMSGGKWMTFRKNSRKWPRDRDWWWGGRSADDSEERLLVEWFSGREDTVYDPEIIAYYVLNPSLPTVRRGYLYDKQGLAAVNVWDENYFYINFRFCICRQEDGRFLDEFARLQFYLLMCDRSKGKLVNDGGALDSEGLERFKDKMNPRRKRQVSSWQMK